MQANQRKIDLEKLLKHRSKVREAQALDLRDGFDDFDMFTGPPVFPLLSDIKYGPPIFSLLINFSYLGLQYTPASLFEFSLTPFCGG